MRNFTIHRVLPFLTRAYMQQNYKFTLHSNAKAFNSLLQKAVPLLVWSLDSEPCSKNTAFSWQLTFADSWYTNGLQMEKKQQSATDECKQMMGTVTPILVLLLLDWCLVYWLTFFTHPYSSLNACLCCWCINSLGKGCTILPDTNCFDGLTWLGQCPVHPMAQFHSSSLCQNISAVPLLICWLYSELMRWLSS